LRFSPRRRVQRDELNRGNKNGCKAAERRDGAAARPKNSGDGSKATGCTGSTTSDVGGCLTSLRVSWAASPATKGRRSRGFDGGGRKLELGFRVAAAHGARAARARVGEVPGWRRALNSPEKGPWRAGHVGREACSHRTRRRRSPWRGRLGRGDDRWVPSVSLSGERRRRRGPTTAKQAGWAESSCGLAVLLGQLGRKVGRAGELPCGPAERLLLAGLACAVAGLRRPVGWMGKWVGA
jgi:hypothetical protein